VAAPSTSLTTNFAKPIAPNAGLGPTGPATNPAAMGGRFSHAGITSGCATCHNGVRAPGKPVRHLITSAPCETCHRSTVTFAGARMNHSGIIGNCVSCHNGVTAIAKPPKHIPTTAPCETCHKSTVTFAGARMDHATVTAPCASCHNGVTASAKPQRHFMTTQPCELCHRTAMWTPVTYRHMSPRYPDHGRSLECNACHTTNAQTIPWKFPAYQPDCAACHATQFRPTAHPKLQRPMTVYYTLGELRDCTGSCHVYADSSMRSIVTRRFGEHRANRGGW
jgi:hypothetical protein